MRDFFTATLHSLASKYGWTLDAWCVLSNHYHFVGHSPAGGANPLRPFVQHLHSVSTRERNRVDETPGRSRLWQNYWETPLALPRAYLVRLHYTHANAVYPRLVAEPAQWRWSSAARFEQAVTPAWRETIYGFRFEEIAVGDGE